MSKEAIEAVGKVIEVLPSTVFKVQLQGGQIIQSYLSGRLKMNNIKIVEGDTVKVEISPYDLTIGRIVWRGKDDSKKS